MPGRLDVRADPATAVAALAARSDLAIVATPMAGLRQMLSLLREHSGPLAWLCKGFEAPLGSDGLLGHEIKAEVAPA